MQPERWKQIEALFQSAVLLSAPERTAYLTQACQGDETLRREVEALLAADHGAAEDTLAVPGQIAAEMFAEQHHLQAGQLINYYRIVSPLGAGGMGVVYLAEDTRQGIHFVTGESSQRSMIEFYDFATGKVTLAAKLQTWIPPALDGLSVSPDGRRIIYM